MPVKAIYWRYHSRCADEFDTFDEAIRFLWDGEEYGDLSSEEVVGEGRTISRDQLDEFFDQLESGEYKTQDYIDAECEEIIEPVALLPAPRPELTCGPGWPD